MILKKLSTGNYSGWVDGCYVFISRRSHGGWNATISGYVGRSFCLLASEGYFSKSLPTVRKAREWAKDRLKTDLEKL